MCALLISLARRPRAARPGLAPWPGPEKFICTCLEAFVHSIRAHVLWVQGLLNPDHDKFASHRRIPSHPIAGSRCSTRVHAWPHVMEYNILINNRYAAVRLQGPCSGSPRPSPQPQPASRFFTCTHATKQAWRKPADGTTCQICTRPGGTSLSLAMNAAHSCLSLSLPSFRGEVNIHDGLRPALFGPACLSFSPQDL